MKKKKGKVFIGCTDIASFIEDWDYGLKENGYDTIKVIKKKQHVIQSSAYDICIEDLENKINLIPPRLISKRIRKFWHFLVNKCLWVYVLAKCDTFIFIWEGISSSLEHDYIRLKRHKKKIITLFVGSEVRSSELFAQELNKAGVPVTDSFIKAIATRGGAAKLKPKRVSTAERYSDLTLGQKNYMQLSTKDYVELYIPIQVSRFSPAQKQRKIPKIVHAPSHREIKGTAIVEKVISELRDEGLAFDFQMIENVPHKAALELYRDCDIVIDQLNIPGGGKLCYETLAMSKVVLSNMAYENYNMHLPDSCPVVDVNPETLKETLRSLITNVEMRDSIAQQSLAYTKEYHDAGLVVARVMERLK